MAAPTNLDALTALLTHPGLKPVRDARAVATRLVGLGIVDGCTRCFGSGHYGPQSVNAGRCFKCNGKGTQAPKVTRKLVARVREAVEAGALDTYAAKCQALAKARREAKGAYERAAALYGKTSWYSYFYREGGKHCPLSHALVRLTESARERALDLHIAIKLGRSNDSAGLLAACADFVAALEQLDRAHAVALERGSYVESAAKAETKGGFDHAHYDACCKQDYAQALEIWASVA